MIWWARLCHGGLGYVMVGYGLCHGGLGYARMGYIGKLGWAGLRHDRLYADKKGE